MLFFDDAAFEIGSGTCAIRLDVGCAVLHHDHAIAVVGVRNGKGILAQTVEKHLFRVAIILETAW